MTTRAETSDLAAVSTEFRAPLGMLSAAGQMLTMDLVQLNDPGREKSPPRQRWRRAAATTEFGQALDILNLSQLRTAKLFGVTPRHIRRWRRGDRAIPTGVVIVCNLLASGAVAIDQVERPLPPRMNGSAKPGPRAPLLIEPTLEQSAVAPAQAATLAAPSPSIAEQICALSPTSCRWPCGDPGRADFYFCGSPVVRSPYWEHHRTMAYTALPTRRLTKSLRGDMLAAHHKTASEVVRARQAAVMVRLTKGRPGRVREVRRGLSRG